MFICFWEHFYNFLGPAELVDMFFVDTTPFVGSYFTDSEGHTYDWRGVKSRWTYIKSLLKVLSLSSYEKENEYEIYMISMDGANDLN